MAKYHFNRETGRANICRAQHNCPLGADTPHFDTKEEAKAYVLEEAKESSNTFNTLSKVNKAPAIGAPKVFTEESGEKVTYHIPEDNFEKAMRNIERANKRLEAFGMEGRFEPVVEELYDESTNEWGVTKASKSYRITLNSPEFKYGGYKFLAAAIQEEKGIIVKSKEGTELNGWRPESMACDHCGKKRARSKSYLIESPDGEVKQIGSSCVNAYMGLKPEALNYLEYDLGEYSDKEDDENHERNSAPTYLSTDDTLALALAFSNNGRNYISTQGIWSESTAGQVNEFLNPTGIKDDEYIKWRDEMQSKADDLIRNGEVSKLKKKLQKIDGSNDYINNIKVLSSGEWVRGKNFTLLVSSVAVIGREERAERRANEAIEREELEKKRISEAPKGYYLEKGAKIPKGSKFTVTEIKEYEAYNPYTRNYEKKLSVNMLSEDNKNIQWFTTPPRDENGERVSYNVGEELEVSSGKVKSHGDYKGVDQTVISNVRLMK